MTSRANQQLIVKKFNKKCVGMGRENFRAAQIFLLNISLAGILFRMQVNKLTSVFYASVLLLMINFVITLSNTEQTTLHFFVTCSVEKRYLPCIDRLWLVGSTTIRWFRDKTYVKSCSTPYTISFFVRTGFFLANLMVP